MLKYESLLFLSGGIAVDFYFLFYSLPCSLAFKISSLKIPFINRNKKHFKGHVQNVEKGAPNYKWNTKERYKPLKSSVRNAEAITQAYE